MQTVVALYSKTDAIVRPWVDAGFVMPASFVAPDLVGTAPDDRIHKAPPSDDRADFRSATPLGFSRAAFASNFMGGELAA